MIATPRNLLAAALALVLVGACGGGTTAGGVGEGGSGFAAGTVTGFGSLFVGGSELDTTQAVYRIDEDPRAPQAAVATDIALGMQVAVSHDRGLVHTATAGAALIGPLASVDTTNGILVALGQTVRVDPAPAAPTAFDGFATLAALAPGQVIEVDGQRAVDGSIGATRLALRAPGTTLVRLAGPVAVVDTANRRFTIGNETIDYTTAQLLPTGHLPVVGDQVVVFAAAGASGATIAADAVRIDSSPPDAPDARVDGLVSGLAAGSAALQFRVGTTVVDATGATFSGGSAGDLANGSVVRVAGGLAGGVLTAQTVSILRNATDAPVQLLGPITDFVDAGSRFRVRGAPVQLGSGTSERPGSNVGLANGVAVSITGSIASGAVAASGLGLIEPDQDGFVPIVAGIVSGLNQGASQFVLGATAVTVVVGPATVYVNGAAADLANGRHVVVHGAYDATARSLAATQVRYEDNEASLPTVHLSGTATAVGATSFTVDDVVVSINGQTRFFAGESAVAAASLQNGATVDVTGTAAGGVVTASTVRIQQPAASGTVRVSGFVTAFASLASFNVANQPVDASAAQIVSSGPVTTMANGVFVAVEGTLAGGVLVATRVTIEPGGDE